MSSLLLALLALGTPPDRQCDYYPTNPPQKVCHWTECSAETPPVCRKVSEREDSACTCTTVRTRTECDAEGKNCKTWTWKREDRT